jgi:hypothetical protein
VHSHISPDEIPSAKFRQQKQRQFIAELGLDSLILGALQQISHLPFPTTNFGHVLIRHHKRTGFAALQSRRPHFVFKLSQ